MLIGTVWADTVWLDIWGPIWAASGAVIAPVWTVQAVSNDSWTAQTKSTDVWTVQTESSDAWTVQ